MKKSIRYYFFSSMAAVLIASVVVMGIIQSVLAVSYFRSEKETLLQAVADGVVRGTREGQISVPLANTFTINYMAHIAGATVFIVDAEGIITYSTDEKLLPGTPVSGKVIEQVAAGNGYNELGRLDGLFESNQYVASAIISDPQDAPMGYVFAVTDASGLALYLSDLASSFLLSAALVLLVASAVALVLTNRMVVPIRRISEAARQFGEGNYAARVPVEGDNELAHLAVTFNEMANSFEATDTSRRSFMGNIAHELRTPMTTIKGFIDGMLDGTIPLDQRDKYLTIVSEEVGRLARLTKNMLDISRLEAGEYTPETTVFNIWEPITSVFLSSEQRLEENQIEVGGLEDVVPLYVQGDEDFVHQVLFNLVDNAIKFTPPGGTISASTKVMRNAAEVSIRNTGAGISPAVLSHIFDRFYKADESRGINARGSGLGLHICKVLVGLMGGRIWVESEEGSFTEFHFTIPCAPPKRIAALRAQQRAKDRELAAQRGEKKGGWRATHPPKTEIPHPPAKAGRPTGETAQPTGETGQPTGVLPKATGEKGQPGAPKEE